MDSIRLFDGMYSGMEQVLNLRNQQHILSATNLANADTPGYKAREIPFETLLKEVMETSVQEEAPLDLSEVAVHELEAPPWVRDGNSVNAERETAKLTSNSLMYNAVSKGISARLGMLRFAASDGKG